MSYQLKNILLGLLILAVLLTGLYACQHYMTAQELGLKVDSYQIQLDDCASEIEVRQAERENLNQEIGQLKVAQEKWYKSSVQAEYKLGTCKKSLAKANGEAREEYQFANGAFHTCVYVIYRLTGQNGTQGCVKFTQSLLDQEAWKLEPSEQFYQYFGGLNQSSVKPTPKGTQINY